MLVLLTEPVVTEPLCIPLAPPSSCFLDGVKRFDLRRDFLDEVGVVPGVAPSFSSLKMLEVDTKLFVLQEGTTNFTSEPETNEDAELEKLLIEKCQKNGILYRRMDCFQ